MDKVLIVRGEHGPEGTFGKLTAPMFECYTLERPAEGDHPRIPNGTYKVVWTVGVHPLHKECYEITKVKDRTAILIHSANWFDQLLGCVALGRAIADAEGEWPKGTPRKMKGITSSHDAVAGFVAAMAKKDFELTITEAA